MEVRKHLAVIQSNVAPGQHPTQAAGLYDPTRYEFRWNDEYSYFAAVRLRWHDNASYLAYQADDAPEFV